MVQMFDHFHPPNLTLLKFFIFKYVGPRRLWIVIFHEEHLYIWVFSINLRNFLFDNKIFQIKYEKISKQKLYVYGHVENYPADNLPRLK